VTSTSSLVLLARVCGGCQDVVPLAITVCAETFHLGWICSKEYDTSLQPSDREGDAALPAHDGRRVRLRPCEP